jgi:hypothetical protein
VSFAGGCGVREVCDGEMSGRIKAVVDKFVRELSLFVWLVADGWYWFVLREKYCWLVAGGWFVLREKYC